ncbi:MAG: cytidylate kinase [Bacteroidetes bacterium]|jgi:cytidylate kinase|nr:cytidylate kinase [Bacteroidota bacterium]
MSRITIAIDGYSSCGKSTLAKALAAKLNYAYIDSGAMYRCVTLYCLRKGLINNKQFIPEEIIACLPDIKLSFKFNPFTKTSETFLNGENVEKEIRSMEIAANVSKISTIKEVRQHMVAIQREFGIHKGVVMDGRDIGSHVFPHAELKLFMTADIETRVNRRMDELNSKGQHVEFQEVKMNLEQRDYDDTHRKESPLTKAKNAIVLDNTDLNKEEQLEYVLRLINDQLLTRD